MRDESLSSSRRRTPPRWSRLVAGYVGLIALGLLGLESVWIGGPTNAFLAAVAVVVVLESALVYRLLGAVSDRDQTRRNQRSTGRPVTLATWVTVARGSAVAVLAGFVVVESDPATAITIWVPAGLFAVAAALDAVDGLLARATDTVTDLGARLDVETDSLVVLVGTLVAVVDGSLPVVFLAVAGARYVFVAGRWWRTTRNRPVYDLPPNRFRRLFGALAMGTIWLALLPVPDDTVSRGVALIVLGPFLANFCWDWLAVTGRRAHERS